MAEYTANELSSRIDAAVYSGKVPKVSGNDVNDVLHDVADSSLDKRSNVLAFGDDLGGNKVIEARTTAITGDRPKIRFNSVSAQWEYSNDGSQWQTFSSGEILDNAVTLAKMQDGSGQEVYSTDASGNPQRTALTSYQVAGRNAGDVEAIDTEDLEDQGHSTFKATVNANTLWMRGTLYRAFVAIAQIGNSSSDTTLFNSTTNEYYTGAASHPADSTSGDEFLPAGYLKLGMRIRLVFQGEVTHGSSTGVVFKVDLGGSNVHTLTSAVSSKTGAAFCLTIDMTVEEVNVSTGKLLIVSRYEVDGEAAEVKRSRATGLDTTIEASLNATGATGSGDTIDVDMSEVLING